MWSKLGLQPRGGDRRFCCPIPKRKNRVGGQCCTRSRALLIANGFQPELPSASALKVGNPHPDSTFKSEVPDVSGAGLGLPHQANDRDIEGKAGPGAGTQEDTREET